MFFVAVKMTVKSYFRIFTLCEKISMKPFTSLVDSVAEKLKDLAFTTTLIARPRFNPHPSHVIRSFDRTRDDNYPYLVASNKQQTERTQIQINQQGIESANSASKFCNQTSLIQEILQPNLFS